MRQDEMATALGIMQALVLDVNVANGWFDSERTVGDDVALIHSEASEFLEAWRDYGFEDMTEKLCKISPDHEDHICKPEGAGSEAADILVRLLDTCERRNIDLFSEFVRKLAYNKTRGYRHGGKRV